MPRSYSFDHFQVPQAEPRSRSLRRQDKQHLASSRQETQRDEGIHYGKNHAETEEILRARAAAAHSEAPAEGAPEEGGRAASAREERAPEQVGPRPHRNTTPIGSLPATEELPPRGRLRDLIDEASRQLRALRGGLGDATQAAARLASLPLEVVRLAARRLRLVHS